MGSKGADLTGQKFGDLTVLEKTDLRVSRCIVWKCLCDCGNEHLTSSANLKKSKYPSCGCVDKERRIGNKYALLHGASPRIGNHSTEYNSWDKLRDKRPPEWKEFTQFLADVGERPTPNHVLARHDVTEPHSKQNTYWRDCSAEQQQRTSYNLGDFEQLFSIDLDAIRANAAAATSNRS